MRYERCVGYFKDAIRTMTPEELSKLVLFISGSKVLPLTKMTVFFSNHVQDHMPLEYALIPIARTCSLRMEMSSMFFEEQSDLFNKCLLRAMDSMAHSAFQFA